MSGSAGWGTVASYQLGGVIGCVLGITGLVFGGWAALPAIGIAIVTGAVAGTFINALDKANQDLGQYTGSGSTPADPPKVWGIEARKDGVINRTAKRGTDFVKTTTGKAVTGGVAVVLLASSVAGNVTNNNNQSSSGSESRNTNNSVTSSTSNNNDTASSNSNTDNLRDCDYWEGRPIYDADPEFADRIEYRPGRIEVLTFEYHPEYHFVEWNFCFNNVPPGGTATVSIEVSFPLDAPEGNQSLITVYKVPLDQICGETYVLRNIDFPEETVFTCSGTTELSERIAYLPIRVTANNLYSGSHLRGNGKYATINLTVEIEE